MALIKHGTYGEVIHQASSFFPARKDLVERLLCDRQQWNKTMLVQQLFEVVPTDVLEQFNADLQQLIDGKPLQYIVGIEWFYGRMYQVSSATLIPRPETELLVEEALKHLDKKEQARILDIGTGTGAIGISLKCERPHDTVVLSDISQEALMIAQQNAQQLEATVTLVQSDVCEHITGQFDCIVSNPPYISETEKNEMDSHVLNYEPHTALFAADNGLAIYKKLAQQLPHFLAPQGIIVLEFGYKQAETLKDLFQKAFPKAKISVKQDYAGLDRLLVIEGE